MTTDRPTPELVNPFPNSPHAWIQWKGTEVCMDVHCACGVLLHFDGYCAYHVQCPYCDQWYSCNGHIRLEPITPEARDIGSGSWHRLERDDD